MELIDARCPKGDWFLRIASDWQIGSPSTSTSIIEKVMEPVNERSDYRFAFVGDGWDAVGPRDKRFSWEDLDENAPNVLAQVRLFKSYLAHAASKKRIISLGTGNHELVSANDIGDLSRYVAEELDVPYGGYSAVVRLNKQDEILLWHGRPSISSTLPDAHSRNMALKRRLVRTNRARWPQYGQGSIKLFAQGHVNHLFVVSPEESRQMDMGVNWDGAHGPEITNKYERADAAWYAVCGSAQRLFVKGRTTYAEARGYGPLSLGCVDAHFRNGKLLDVEAVHLG